MSPRKPFRLRAAPSFLKHRHKRVASQEDDAAQGATRAPAQPYKISSPIEGSFRSGIPLSKEEDSGEKASKKEARWARKRDELKKKIKMVGEVRQSDV